MFGYRNLEIRKTNLGKIDPGIIMRSQQLNLNFMSLGIGNSFQD